MNTIDDLGHPLILETAKNLAFKQVGLGFCAPQDHQDLVQDLLLYLCRQFSRYTGNLPLATWACRLLHGRINAINRRLFGIPNPNQQRRSRQASMSAGPERPTTHPTTAPAPATGPMPSEPAPSEQPSTPTRPHRPQAPYLEIRPAINQPGPTPAASVQPETEPQATPAQSISQPPNPDAFANPPISNTEPRTPPPEVRTWRQRLRRLGSAVASWWSGSS